MRVRSLLSGAATILTLVSAAPLAAQPVLSGAPQPKSLKQGFGSLSDNSVVGNQLPAFTMGEYACANSTLGMFFGGSTVISNLTGWGTSCNGGSTTVYPALTFLFNQPIASFGFMQLSLSNNLTVTTNNGSVTTSVVPYGQTFAPQFVGITDVSGFSEVTISGDGSEALAVDDVSFTLAAPEPASAALLATGLVGIAGFARRRRKTS